MRLLLRQPRDDAGERRIGRHAHDALSASGRHRRLQLRPVDRVVDDVHARRIGVHLPDVEVAHRFRGHDHAVGAAHQQALGERMVRPLVLVDVHFGADDDRDAGEHGGEASVQARGEQERVHDVRLQLTKMSCDPEHVPGPPDAGIQTEHPERARRSF